MLLKNNINSLWIKNKSIFNNTMPFEWIQKGERMKDFKVITFECNSKPSHMLTGTDILNIVMIYDFYFSMSYTYFNAFAFLSHLFFLRPT